MSKIHGEWYFCEHCGSAIVTKVYTDDAGQILCEECHGQYVRRGGKRMGFLDLRKRKVLMDDAKESEVL